MVRLSLLGMSAIVLGLSWCEWAAAQTSIGRYSVVAIGGLGGDWSEALAINNRGQIVGRAALPKDSNDQVQPSGLLMHPVGPLYHAFLYDNGEMKDLGVPDGSESSEATGINNQGVIVGTSLSRYGDIVSSHPFRYSDSMMMPLLLPGASYVQPNGINDSGQFAGLCNKAGHIRAFFFDGQLTDLGVMPGTDGRRSEAFGLNNRGEVVGVSWISNSGNTHAFCFQQGKMIDLGTLPGHYASRARGINDAGIIVGQSSAPFMVVPDPRAFVYADGTMIHLNSLVPSDSGWVLNEANGINEAGQIVGTGAHRGGRHAFLLTPARQ